VNAIDQFGNEGKNVSPTRTKVLGSAWSYTNLIRLVDMKKFYVPMHRGRLTDMRCPSPDFFNVAASDDDLQLGAEIITIDGALGEL
ncbi:hypothetical protein, partial [Desulfonatronum sp. SC1]|uniref:hypothetical protein n=1 Tax=Desulfonatronum sp. SC1 TaxID=2109626 RepID=UPI0018EEB1C7